MKIISAAQIGSKKSKVQNATSEESFGRNPGHYNAQVYAKLDRRNCKRAEWKMQGEVQCIALYFQNNF